MYIVQPQNHRYISALKIETRHAFESTEKRKNIGQIFENKNCSKFHKTCIFGKNRDPKFPFFLTERSKMREIALSPFTSSSFSKLLVPTNQKLNRNYAELSGIKRDPRNSTQIQLPWGESPSSSFANNSLNEQDWWDRGTLELDVSFATFNCVWRARVLFQHCEKAAHLKLYRLSDRICFCSPYLLSWIRIQVCTCFYSFAKLSLIEIIGPRTTSLDCKARYHGQLQTTTGHDRR